MTRRSVTYVLRTVILGVIIAALCLMAFLTAERMANLYILVSEGMTLRADCVLGDGDVSALTDYFSAGALSRDDKLNTSDDHWLNWLEGIAREDPSFTVTNAEEAQRSSTVCCLGQMCMKLGKDVVWNAKTETSSTPGAAELMKPFRQGKFNLDRAITALKV